MDERGRTPLHIACSLWSSGSEAGPMTVIRYLIQEAACNPYALDVEGKLPEDHISYSPGYFTDLEYAEWEGRCMRARCASMKAAVVAMLQVRACASKKSLWEKRSHLLPAAGAACVGGLWAGLGTARAARLRPGALHRQRHAGDVGLPPALLEGLLRVVLLGEAAAAPALGHRRLQGH